MFKPTWLCCTDPAHGKPGYLFYCKFNLICLRGVRLPLLERDLPFLTLSLLSFSLSSLHTTDPFQSSQPFAGLVVSDITRRASLCLKLICLQELFAQQLKVWFAYNRLIYNPLIFFQSPPSILCGILLPCFCS